MSRSLESTRQAVTRYAEQKLFQQFVSGKQVLSLTWIVVIRFISLTSTFFAIAGIYDRGRGGGKKFGFRDDVI